MKKPLKFLLAGCIGLPVLILLIGVIAYVAMPSEYEVASSITINAESAKIHEYVNNMPRWQEWTVWTTEKYPTMVTKYEGPETGVGARSTWTEENGDGWMEVTQSNPDTGIDFKLGFAEFPESQGHVHYKPADGGGTEVTMGLKGEMPGVWKLFLPVMKGAMEAEYMENLEKLKTVVEGS